ncbi:hypothetical protein L6164_013509 [Bauhinia variegata]|uniref:Uncharacterized protein n=1 Tax=Bauhinia variegata TaxID=167791 RepID=A0ACB9NFC0_BAUVA|nr:hypothetical protein L6164_013509 [Bauhinia variegata]
MTLNGTDMLPSETKIKFASRFLRSLSKIKKPRSASSLKETQKCSERIKVAAYSSMAHAVGSRRAWSRAVLVKLGSRARQRQVLMRRKRSKVGKKCKRVGMKKKKIKNCVLGQENKLRELVPGGKSMDILSLLEETTHYLTCLSAQVKVMQTIADYYSKG